MKLKIWTTTLALLVLAGCGEQEQGQRVELSEEPAQTAENRRAGWPEGVAARVDSANLAYAEGRYQDAADGFRSLTEEHSDIGATWFGLYMAEAALGNDEEAQAALEQAESMTPGMARMHEAAASQDMEGMTMPDDHPPTDLPEGHPTMEEMTEASGGN